MSILSEVRKKIDISNIVEEGFLDGNLIQRRAKLEKIAIFTEIKSEHPEYTNKEICNAMQISPSTMNRIRKDLAVKSPYRYDIQTNRKTTKTNTNTNTNTNTDKKIGRRSNKNPKENAGLDENMHNDFQNMTVDEYITQETAKYKL